MKHLKTMKHLRIIASIVGVPILLALTACGGGGGVDSGGGGQGGAPSGPTVLVTDPPNTAIGASLTKALRVTFSVPVNAPTVNIGSFTLSGPGGSVSGTVTLSSATLGGNVASFMPSAPLVFNADYTARLTTAITDTASNRLAADYIWRFNTGKKIAAGTSHTCARLDSQRLKCWGYNAEGQLGRGDTDAQGDQPNEMGVSLREVFLGTGSTAVELAAGSAHTCARLDDGRVKCWGNNNAGQLGVGDTDAQGDQPLEMGNGLRQVFLGTGSTAVELAAGSAHTCARLDGGQVKCWGNNNVGQLGLGDMSNRGDGPDEMADNLPAVDLGSGRTAVELVAGSGHTCARLDNGAVKCWGFNLAGQLGLGDASARGDGLNPQTGLSEMGDNLPAVDLGSRRTAVELVAGDFHTCARLDNGQVKCWGFNNVGQLGRGDTDNWGDGPNEMGDKLPAVDLGTASLGRRLMVIQLAAGANHTCARLIDSFVAGPVQIKCWGHNGFGQLGHGNPVNRGDGPNQMGNNLPMVDLGQDALLGNYTALEVAADGNHTCAHLGNGQIKCWGNNDAGQLGLGDINARGDGPNPQTGLSEMGNNLPAVDLGT